LLLRLHFQYTGGGGATFLAMIHMSLAYDTAVGLVRSLYDRSITTPPVLDPVRYFPNATRFTERWHDIRSEALATAAELKNIPRFHDIMPQQRDIPLTTVGIGAC
jgi:hypothetical protein